MRPLHLEADRLTIGTFVKTDSAQVVEVLGTTPLDYAVVDAEHAPFDRSALDRMMLAGHAVGLPLLVRVPDSASTWVQTALDLGAAGLVVPHVDSVDDARTLVARARFRSGRRGLSLSPRFAGYGTRLLGDVVAQADRAMLVCQIESAEAVNAAAAIAAVEGVAALFIGRLDLAMSMGIEDPLDRRVLDATRHVVDAALAAGSVAALAASSVEEAAGFVDWGASSFVIGSDQSLMRGAAQAIATAQCLRAARPALN